MELSCVNEKELDAIASQLIKTHAEARVFAFHGKMGAGKTTFIKHICKQLKALDTAVSPSFGIVNEYKTASHTSIFHFDFYRIKNVNEFMDLGCDDYFYSGSYCFIEWPEKIDEYLPEGHVPVFIDEVDGKRIVKF